MPLPLLTLVVLAQYQSSVPSENRRHAIVDARIEVGDGSVIEKGTIVMDGGRITAVGPGVAVPPGAMVYSGTGITVTPGFIDGWNTKGLSLPAAVTEQDAPTGLVAPSTVEYAPAQMRDANRKGIRPELEARTMLSLNEDFAKPYRSAGFTALHAAPAGGYLGGVGALVNLSGRPNRDAVVVPRTVLVTDFDGPADSGSYPGSLLGRVAQVRQTWLDAQWQAQVRGAYSAGGSDRPASDPSLEALVPFLAAQERVAFAANTPAEIDRALAMAKEFGLRPIIVGGMQGYRRLENLTADGVTVVASLNFGDAPQAVLGEDPARATERKRRYDEAVRNVIELKNAGIPVVLSTAGTKGDELAVPGRAFGGVRPFARCRDKGLDLRCGSDLGAGLSAGIFASGQGCECDRDGRGSAGSYDQLAVLVYGRETGAAGESLHRSIPAVSGENSECEVGRLPARITGTL